MNYKMVIHTLGKVLAVEGALLLLPALVSLCYKEWRSVLIFLMIATASLAVGALISNFVRPRDRVIYAKEGFVIVTLVWLIMSLVGAIPFMATGAFSSYIDAFFETVSGFTTTGASVVTDFSKFSHGVLFWRSFTHWIGGMGVLTFVMAIFNNVSDRSIHIMRAEMPGPVIGKIVPRVKETAKILYLIYIALTVLEAVLLLCGGMPLFDSMIHALGTAGTGGFGIRPDGVSGYSPYLQWVIAIFMLLFGINFNLYFLILIGRARSALRSTELWCYFAIVGVSITSICINIYPIYRNVSEILRLSVFQVTALITTTGYATADFNLWPEFSKAILLLLMMIGGCAGSTAGGLKVSRVILLIRLIRREFRKLLHPRSVTTVRMESKQVDDLTLGSVSTYFAVYVLGLFATFLLISLDAFSFETNFSVAVSCFNNIGPAFGAAGPMGSYAGFNPFSKLVLTFAMLFGRLEIFPILLALSPTVWSRQKR